MHLLFWLSLIPFATGWMGENRYSRNTVIVYAVLLLVCGIAFTILQITIQKTNELSAQLEEAFVVVRRKGIISVICYSAAIGFAFLNTIISGILFVLVAAMSIIPDKNIEKALKG